MKAKIRLAFRIEIDKNSEYIWDRYVFEDTYQEYKIQHQVFNSKNNPVENYWELLLNNEHAKKMPFLISASVDNYIKQLKGEIRSIKDVLGNRFFKFENFKVDIVSSNINDPSKHKIGITFYSPKLILVDIIDNKYLLSENENKETVLETYMLAFHSQIAICEYEKL